MSLRLDGARVVVAGAGVAGRSAARVLRELGATVLSADRADGTDQGLPPGVDLVVTSPGWRPDQPLLVAAAAAGVPVWGDVELAHRLRPPGQRWLGVTGTNGKTTTVQMLESVLRAAGLRTVACGNVGLPVLDAVGDPEPYDVLAVEVSSFQLHWASTVTFDAAAVLNLAEDHLDWHGLMDAYAAAKATVWRGARDGAGCAVYNADDPLVADLVARTVPDPARRVGFTLGAPAPGQLGVRAGADQEPGSGSGSASASGSGSLVSLSPAMCSAPGGGAEHSLSGGAPVHGSAPGGGAEHTLAEVGDVRPAAPHNVANALAAAALARTVLGEAATPGAVREGLRAFTPGGHRIAVVGEHAGVTYVDDSKATNPHAAAASLAAFPRVVWVAGGLAKGARFEDVVAGAASRMRAAVLLGRDRALVAEALARHAPQIPVVQVERTDTGAMDDVVRAAAGLAEPGDTVLLAPACASMDMFADYAARGDAFAAAVARLARTAP